jgi:UDP:flavonoid glycosyltransferase YjiC (YdhE family)
MNGKVKLIGPITENHAIPSDEQVRLKRKLGFDPKRPLIYAAVSGPRVERSVLAAMLAESLPGLAGEFQVVLSRGEPEGDSRGRLVHGVRVFDWIDNQDDFIRASDLIVSRAGHGTIMKALVYGKPLVLIPIPDHTEQYANARRATSLNIARMIDQKSLTPKTLKTSIQSIVNSDEYKRRASEISEEASSTHAVSSACNVITQLAKQT